MASDGRSKLDRNAYRNRNVVERCFGRLKVSAGKKHHPIVDNYIIHKSRKTLRWLKKNPKFIVIYQPVYSPWVNHVELLWQALHDTITRNHSCRSMWQLLNKGRHFMKTASPFLGRKHGQVKV